MRDSKDTLLSMVRNGGQLTTGQQIRLTMLLSIPAILAQFSSVMMQYIDASMVGNLGANPSASIGLVASSTWIFGGFVMGAASGFSVQIAHFCGSKDYFSARNVMRKGLVSLLLFGLLLGFAGYLISGPLPVWLGGSAEINEDASGYFAIFSAFLPMMALSWTAGGMLQASGNMKIPSILNIMMCVLDVIFNYIFIYGFDMGVRGAALGTGVAETLTAGGMLYFLLARSEELSVRGEHGNYIPDAKTLRNAFSISGPMWLQNIVMRGAYVVATLIVSPLGAISIAANAFAITAESFCYMPGYGIEEASTTLVGQSLGAKRRFLAKQFARMTTLLAAGIMTIMAVAMFAGASVLMGILSKDPEVVALGAKVLRIEAFAETMYAVSIVAYGACVGAGSTLVPTILNFVSMWVVRIGLAAILTPRMGLTGYWVAMCIELNVRGLLFVWWLRGDKWLRNRSLTD